VVVIGSRMPEWTRQIFSRSVNKYFLLFEWWLRIASTYIYVYGRPFEPLRLELSGASLSQLCLRLVALGRQWQQLLLFGS
jgi:hypothetical protein